MSTPAAKAEQPKAPAAADRFAAPQSSPRATTAFADTRAAAATQRQQQQSIDTSSRQQQAAASQKLIAHSPRQRAAQLQAKAALASANNTGLPDNLKAGVENLSGYSLDDVQVHYNSDKPAQLQAHAYAQGTDIHVAPGQEQHLPHEAWHVVQQKQGRVKPTRQLKGKVAVNDDAGLEKEADVMGAKALQRKTASKAAPASEAPKNSSVLQRAINVNATTRKGSVVIANEGNASKYRGGSEAKNNGWNGVEKYKAEARVGNNPAIILGTTNNNYIVAQAGHVLAEQNGGNGNDPENVFAQDGGVNNGPFRSNFENPMRKQLDEADAKDNVQFRVVLYGKNITKGPLKKSGQVDASDEETDFEGFDSADSGSMSD